MSKSDTSTRGVRIEVESEYLTDKSDPQNQYYFFAYHITLTNQSMQTVQLLNRHWIITDGTGHVEEVKGAGVVGDQPILQPGDQYQYTSFCPLKTPQGSMRGSYEMTQNNGEHFDAKVGEFRLEATYTLH